MFPQDHFHQEIVLLKNKHNKPYILTVYKTIKFKHFDLIFKILHYRIPIFGPILPSTNRMQQGSFTLTKHTRHTLISFPFSLYLKRPPSPLFFLSESNQSLDEFVEEAKLKASSIKSSSFSNQWLPSLFIFNDPFQHSFIDSFSHTLTPMHVQISTVLWGWGYKDA